MSVIISATRVGHLRPDVDDLVVPLAVGDQTLGVLLFNLATSSPGLTEQHGLGVRDDHVVDADRDAGDRWSSGNRGCAAVGEQNGLLLAAAAHRSRVDELGELLLAMTRLTSRNGSSFGTIS
jgi:hypothetical protein